MGTPLWDELQRQCNNDYDQAIGTLCIMRDLLYKFNTRRYKLVADFIRRADYEAALREIFDLTSLQRK
jgi:hypothetical protein